MADRSPIEWTGATWNPTTGCDRTSPGCDNCYALALAERLKAMGTAKYQHDGDPRTSGPGFGLTLHPQALAIPLRWRAPRFVFVDSMSDLFHPDVPDDFIGQVLAVIRQTPSTPTSSSPSAPSDSPPSPTGSTGQPTCGWASAAKATRTPSEPASSRR
jgi:protein gp37